MYWASETPTLWAKVLFTFNSWRTRRRKRREGRREPICLKRESTPFKVRAASNNEVLNLYSSLAFIKSIHKQIWILNKKLSENSAVIINLIFQVGIWVFKYLTVCQPPKSYVLQLSPVGLPHARGTRRRLRWEPWSRVLWISAQISTEIPRGEKWPRSHRNYPPLFQTPGGGDLMPWRGPQGTVCF